MFGRRRELLLEHRGRAAHRGHLGRGDLRQHLAACGPRLRQGPVGPREHVPQGDQPLLGVLPYVQHRLDLTAYVLQRERGPVVAPGVRTAAAGSRAARRREPEGQRVRDHPDAQLRQLGGDVLQVVAGGVLARPHAHRVGQRAGAVQLGGEQVDPGGKRRPHGVGGDHHVERARVQAVHPGHQLGEREPLRQRDTLGAGPGDQHSGPAQPLGQLDQVLAVRPAASLPYLPGGGQGPAVGVEVRPQPGDVRVGGRPPLLGGPAQRGALQQPAPGVVLEGEQRGLDGLVLRAQPGQGAVDVVPVHHCRPHLHRLCLRFRRRLRVLPRILPRARSRVRNRHGPQPSRYLGAGGAVTPGSTGCRCLRYAFIHGLSPPPAR